LEKKEKKKKKKSPEVGKKTKVAKSPWNKEIK